jgi:protein TonB
MGNLEKNDQGHDMDEIVFDQRNKSYGAYFLRRRYSEYVLTATFIAVVMFSIVLITPVAYRRYFVKQQKIEDLQVVEVNLENVEIPEVPPEDVPPPPVEPPKISSVKFLEPEVKPDDQVKEEKVATQEELKESNPGEIDQKGEKGPPPVEPVKAAEPAEVVIGTWAPQMPEFPGGPSEFLNYLKKNIEYPQRAIDEEKEGTVKITFVVNVDGKISDVKIVKSVGYGFDEEAVRVFKSKSMPVWKPAKKNGQIVPIRMTWPVVFDLE